MNLNLRHRDPDLKQKQIEMNKYKVEIQKAKLAIIQSKIDKMGRDDIAMLEVVKYLTIGATIVLSSVCMCQMSSTISKYNNKIDIHERVNNFELILEALDKKDTTVIK